MVVFTSGIVDEGPVVGSVSSQYYRSSRSLCGGGWVVWNLGMLVWWGVVAHCWALRNQTSVSRFLVVSVPLSSGVPVWVGRGLVGWLFVNWIVDASICDRTSPGPVTF